MFFDSAGWVGVLYINVPRKSVWSGLGDSRRSRSRSRYQGFWMETKQALHMNELELVALEMLVLLRTGYLFLPAFVQWSKSEDPGRGFKQPMNCNCNLS